MTGSTTTSLCLSLQLAYAFWGFGAFRRFKATGESRTACRAGGTEMARPLRRFILGVASLIAARLQRISKKLRDHINRSSSANNCAVI